MRCFKSGLLLLVLAIVSCSSSIIADRQADLVIYNGTIYTMDAAQPVAEMVVVNDGRIVYVGGASHLDAWVGEHTRTLDLQGRTMTPGLIESHAHPLALGYAIQRLDLSSSPHYEAVIEKVQKAVALAPPGQWIIGFGWHQSKWSPAPNPMVKGFQTHTALSRVSPDHPVWLIHASGHAALANQKAMAIAGITPDIQFTAGGEVIKDQQGRPTGIFTEKAQHLVRRHIPQPTPQSDYRALEQAIEAIAAAGITSVRDAGVGPATLALYRQLLQEQKLKVRLWVMLDGSDAALLAHWYQKGPEIGSGHHYLTIRAIKLFADGALGSRGAWLLDPYTDREGHRGHPTIPMERIYQVSRQALKHGFQVCVHAIGDRANREVLNQFERALQEHPAAASDHRFRIEHAQHISTEDIPRFAALGVIASMQGIHMASDRPWAIERLGHRRIVEGAYVWQKLLQSGAIVVNGTDAPVEPINPVASFYASVTRQTLEGLPPGGYEPEQKMSRHQALRSYTLDAAYAGFEEDLKGSIEAGKLADFTIFSDDLLTVEDHLLLKVQVEGTIVNGKWVYRSAHW